MKRSSLREQIFKILFRVEFNPVSDMPAQEERFFDSGDLEVTDKDKEYITNKVNHILEKLPEIDGLLSKNMKGWTLDRVGSVELAILRLAVYEIVYDKDIPTGVAISEAVELARKFGGENSGSFVNGVLARFAPDKPRKTAQEDQPSGKDPSAEAVSQNIVKTRKPKKTVVVTTSASGGQQ